MCRLICHCGSTVMLPPIACNAQIECRHPCIRQSSCGHPVVPHTCHEEGPCPPCAFLTKKVCRCGTSFFPFPFLLVICPACSICRFVLDMCVAKCVDVGANRENDDGECEMCDGFDSGVVWNYLRKVSLPSFSFSFPSN